MSRSSSVPLAAICLGAGVAFLVYILASGLDTTGRHLLIISLARLGFLAGLAAAVAFLGLTSGLGRIGLGLATGAAAFNVVGAVGHVATDGWSYNPFEDEAPGPWYDYWYAYVIGMTLIMFMVGTVLVGIAALRSGVNRVLAIAILLAGILNLLSPLAAIGHAIWTLPWLAVAILILRAQRKTATTAPA